MRLPVAEHRVVADVVLQGEDQLLHRAVALAVGRGELQLQAVVTVEGVGSVGVPRGGRKVQAARGRVAGQGRGCAGVAEFTAVFIVGEALGVWAAADLKADGVLLWVEG